MKFTWGNSGRTKKVFDSVYRNSPKAENKTNNTKKAPAEKTAPSDKQIGSDITVLHSNLFSCSTPKTGYAVGCPRTPQTPITARGVKWQLQSFTKMSLKWSICTCSKKMSFGLVPLFNMFHHFGSCCFNFLPFASHKKPPPRENNKKWGSRQRFRVTYFSLQKKTILKVYPISLKISFIKKIIYLLFFWSNGSSKRLSPFFVHRILVGFQSPNNDLSPFSRSRDKQRSKLFPP